MTGSDASVAVTAKDDRLAEVHPTDSMLPPVPRVTVVIPAYNAAAVLGETLASVQAQTYGDWQIVVADVSMSLDNVLAVAGAAREHPAILVFGLLLSIALMGVAASYIARLLHKYRWIGYVGLAIVLYVALHMMWQGHQDIIRDLGYLPAYNAAMPDFLDIQPKAPAH